MTNETSPCLIEKALKEFIHYSNQYEDTNFLEMKETIKPEIDEKNVNEYIKGYLQSRNLKKSGFEKKRTYETKRRFDPTINQKIELIQKKDSYSNRSKLGEGKKSVRRTVPLTRKLKSFYSI